MNLDKPVQSPPLKALAYFLRLFFHLLYHQMAWTYDWVAAMVSLGRWKKWIYAVLPHLEGPWILELGHGPGHLQVKMHASGYHTVGLDESVQMGRIARKRIASGGFVPMLINGYAQSLPFPDEFFHQVVATFPSEYFSQPETLDEIHRVLQNDGKLLILPVAWITGEGLPLRTAAWLFRVTGQSPQKENLLKDDRIYKMFANAHFKPEFIQKDFEDSTVLIIKASKISAPTRKDTQILLGHQS